ncbi:MULTISPECIES: YjaG family protein [Shewanella]|uniref:YjaG family protein n=1 Tax=Shewanella fidelis TaxID=173509 RepID=A0AAW8NQK0_9GAMM|nr:MULTISPECIES: YjaG family protein [Shewanella]MDR8524640.1 YjaG family protein [Shewanella fidelis]MDW4812115.1 YjaG family protein [Shewanella fidelis]MDW4817430.1 YjaG family protein [Shewanella fidelis]MDW4821497.1 YjaG family protein [Shewanella fidelis]MDW4822722.1 YjaG family protein [Shewanella fidelis]
MTNKQGFFKRLKALELPQKKLFAIALCQRMLPNYQLFSEVCEFGDPKVLDTLLNLLWQSTYDNKLKLNIDIYLQRLEDNTPEPADFDVYGVYPAMDAVVALTSLISALQSKVEEDIVNISKLSSATVANYIEATCEQEFDNEDALDDYIFAHEVMQEEKEMQNSLLEIIEENPHMKADFIKELRREIVEIGVSNIGIEASK